MKELFSKARQGIVWLGQRVATVNHGTSLVGPDSGITFLGWIYDNWIYDSCTGWESSTGFRLKDNAKFLFYFPDLIYNEKKKFNSISLWYFQSFGPILFAICFTVKLPHKDTRQKGVVCAHIQKP